MPPDLQSVRRILAEAREDLFRRYPLRHLAVFGSVVHGDAGPESDIDMLVAFSEPVGFEMVDLAMELEALLGHRVDLVSQGAVRERMRPYVEKDLVCV